MLRYLTAGESHGRELAAILEGMPAGVPVTEASIAAELARRQRGYGRGGRMAIEQDRAVLASGVRHGLTLGSPICLRIDNRDWLNWEREMSPGIPEETFVSGRRVEVPRPGHADLAGAVKYGHDDMRNVLERASARETAARVAVGAVCRALLSRVGITIASMVVRIGDACWQPPATWTPEQMRAAEESDVRCPDDPTAARMRQFIDRAAAAGDTAGGVFEVRVFGAPVGLGSHVSSDRRLDGRLAGALMSLQAIKGVEIGMGFEVAKRPGSEVHDEILPSQARWPFSRPTNNAGGLEGGITNGEPVVVRAAMKPIPTLTRPLRSAELATLSPVEAHAERSDVCAVPAAAVVAEAVVCFVFCQALLEKFGGDHLNDVLAALEQFRSARAGLWGAADVS